MLCRKFYLWLAILPYSLGASGYVVLETTENVLLQVEYVSQNEKVTVVDVSSLLLPPEICEAKEWPKYLPKNKFDKPSKIENGYCRLLGNPYVTRSLSLPTSNIKKRYETTLIIQPKKGAEEQLTFYQDTPEATLGFDFTQDTTKQPTSSLFPLATIEDLTTEVTKRQDLPPVIRTVAKDKSISKIQTKDSSGKITTLYLQENFFHQWGKLNPSLALYYTPLIPTGKIQKLENSYLGFMLEKSVAIPELSFLPLQKYYLSLRGGLNIGFHYFSQDLLQNGVATSEGKITLIPVLGQLTLYWHLKPTRWGVTFLPFWQLADGVIFSMVNTQVKPEYLPLLAPDAEKSRSASYIGHGFNSSVGLEIRPYQWPVAFKLAGGYLLHSQDVTGEFFIFNFGLAWYYGKN